MEVKEIVTVLKQKGRVCIREANGKVVELIAPSAWDASTDDMQGIFLLFEVFQIRTIAEQFSEVSLDVVEYATKPTVYHTVASRISQLGPRQGNQVKFALIRSDFWNKLLFGFGQPLIVQYVFAKTADFEVSTFFPLLSPNAKELYLGPDGDIKIIRG